MPTNNDTLTINYNQRFLISDPRKPIPLAWSVSKYEDTQPLGLIKLKFTQETFDKAHDSAELMLADYYRSEIEPEVSDETTNTHTTAKITYSGTKPTLKVGGNFKTFTASFSNQAAAVDRWLISDENGDITANTNYVIEYDNNNLKLKVARIYELIGTVLTIKVIGTDGSADEVQMEVI
jgi:hypothetical protein